MQPDTSERPMTASVRRYLFWLIVLTIGAVLIVGGIGFMIGVLVAKIDCVC